MNIKKSRTAAIGVVALALALSGCASGSVDGSAPAAADTNSGALTKVTYGIFPSNTVAAFQVAKDKGFFEKHGIDLQLVVGAGSSAAQLPALATGDLDFMLASPVTALTATTQGLDVRIVEGVTQNDPKTVEDSTAVVVGASSTIKTARDLEGKKVSVNALGGIGEIGIREAIAKDGGDPKKVTFVQLSFPEVAAQIEAGQIDAGMAGSPFMQQVVAKGGRVVSDFIHDTGLGANELVSISSGKLVQSDPDKVKRFTDAMKEALPFLTENNGLIREAMPAALGTDPAAAKKAQLSLYSPDVSQETIQLFADLLVKYGIVNTKPDVAKVIWKP
ncbi:MULTISPECIES: ABC transporter substrate-binding protein [unclassified Arthrobacter]|uniref:ABC transporter substrate-binding protein n=1 Tax=unclassified Arthrobacter TaxID=235627 RepID=UPI001C841B27|nr:ABC transporter substrate-binding protein [Arthrobacter sp. MAHUQ-56]MBX7444394.1 ABC transporter substrate-binding protein [Arthrobacter sp. MAHUQ-56]